MSTDWNQQSAPQPDQTMNSWMLSMFYDSQLNKLDPNYVDYVDGDSEFLFKDGAFQAQFFGQPGTVPKSIEFDPQLAPPMLHPTQSQDSSTSTPFDDIYNLLSVSPIFETEPTISAIAPSSDPSVDTPIEDQSPPKRRRGRPRLRSPSEDDDFDILSGRPRRTRLPHNQVERKYRQGLNAELERLRRTIPTLPHRSPGDADAPPKPSKATVLASAISYIQSIEMERDRLREEVETLRRESMRGGCLGCTSNRSRGRMPVG